MRMANLLLAILTLLAGYIPGIEKRRLRGYLVIGISITCSKNRSMACE